MFPWWTDTTFYNTTLCWVVYYNPHNTFVCISLISCLCLLFLLSRMSHLLLLFAKEFSEPFTSNNGLRENIHSKVQIMSFSPLCSEDRVPFTAINNSCNLLGMRFAFVNPHRLKVWKICGLLNSYRNVSVSLYNTLTPHCFSVCRKFSVLTGSIERSLNFFILWGAGISCKISYSAKNAGDANVRCISFIA